MLDQYRQMQVDTATPGELVVMVYECAIRSLEQAKLKLSRNHVEEANECLFRKLRRSSVFWCDDVSAF